MSPLYIIVLYYFIICCGNYTYLTVGYAVCQNNGQVAVMLHMLLCVNVLHMYQTGVLHVCQCVTYVTD